MKKTLCILAILLIFTFMFALADATDLSEVDAKIEKISSYLETPGGPGSEGKIMFTLLLEAILETVPDTSFPPEFADNMEKAKDISDTTSLLNPDGAAYLNNAYRLINDGKDHQMPSSVSKIQDAVNYAKVELASARKDLKAGKIDSCVKRLLDIAVMIVTPMHKRSL